MQTARPAGGIQASGADAAGRAHVRVAVNLSDEELEALHVALERVFHRPLTLEVESTPDILGGVWVRVGDTVIDGSLRGKLETLRHHLRSQCDSLLTVGKWSGSRNREP